MGASDDGEAGRERYKLGREAKRAKARVFMSDVGSDPPAMDTVTTTINSPARPSWTPVNADSL